MAEGAQAGALLPGGQAHRDEDQQRPGGEAVEQRSDIAEGRVGDLVDDGRRAGEEVFPHHALEEVGRAVGMDARGGPGGHRQGEGQQRQHAGQEPLPPPGAGPQGVEPGRGHQGEDGEALEQEPDPQQETHGHHPPRRLAEA